MWQESFNASFLRLKHTIIEKSQEFVFISRTHCSQLSIYALLSSPWNSKHKKNKIYCIICYYLLFFPIHFIVSSSFFHSCNFQQKMRREKRKKKGHVEASNWTTIVKCCAYSKRKKKIWENNSKVKRVKDHWLTSCEAERRETVLTAVNHLTIIK